MRCDLWHLLTNKSFYIFFLRYSPALGVLAFMIHYGLLFAGVKSFMPDYLFDTSLMAALFLLVSSKVFGFCRLHRAFILYIAAASLDVDLHKWLPVPHSLAIPCFMLTAGFVLFVLLFRTEIHRTCARK